MKKVLLTLPLFLFFACQQSLPPEFVARVNDEYIKREELAKEIALVFEGESPDLSGESWMALKKSLLEGLIERKIILEAAKEMGIEEGEEWKQSLSLLKEGYGEQEWQEMVRRYGGEEEWQKGLKEAFIRGKVMDAVCGGIQVGEEELKRYYDEHKEDFRVPERVRVRQIVVQDYRKAMKIHKLLRRKKASFEDLARRYSIAPEGKEGGDLGFFCREEMPQEFEAAFGLKVGQISRVIQSPYGYHIFKVEEKKKATQLEFPQVKERIRDWILQEKREECFQKWLKERKEKARIEINEEALEEIG